MSQKEHFHHESELQALSDEQRIRRAEAIYESIPLDLLEVSKNREEAYGYMQIDGLPFQFAVRHAYTQTVNLGGKTETHPWNLVQTSRPDRIQTQSMPVSTGAYAYMLTALGVDTERILQEPEGSVLASVVKAREKDYLAFTGKYLNDPTLRPDIQFAIAARIEDWEEVVEEEASTTQGMLS